MTSFFLGICVLVVAAVSTLALNSGVRAVKPQTIGNTVKDSSWEVAKAGTMSAGQISPSVVSGFPSLSNVWLARADRLMARPGFGSGAR